MTLRIVRAVLYTTLFFLASLLASNFVYESVLKTTVTPQLRNNIGDGLVAACFICGGFGFLVGFRRPGETPISPITRIFPALRGESSVILWLYSVLFVLPTSFLFLGCLGGSGDDHDRIGSGALIVYFPLMVNIFIMVISLAATPLVRRYSKGWASAHHLRNSIAFPIASVLIAWLGAAIGG